ncbi:peroxisomal hydratase-dehydrogenase-epimerase [Hyaloraphidium curvatum]|nr:peroxisomal hydratase-dehydrogenase-epimerase [Hyaloraphidium curvatum]
MANLRFDGKVAIVTGSGHGIGRATALLLASRGATVLVNDLGGNTVGRGASAEPAAKVAEEIRAAGGRAAANFDSVTDGEKIVEQCMKEFGRIDIIVNCAGIARAKPFETFRDEDWDLVYETHVWGSYKVTRAAWNIMQAQKSGAAIVNITSAAGMYGMFPLRASPSYSAAKAALHGFTLTLAREGAKHGIRCNSLSPMATTRLSGDAADTTRAPAPAASAGSTGLFETNNDPLWIANCIAFLLHPECKSTGHIFEVGGGWIARARWQRTLGALLRPDASLTPGALAAKWDEVIDFGKAEIPEIVMLQPGGQGGTRLEKALKEPPSPKAVEPRFDGRVAVITGSGAGLGRAYALMFAKLGAKVVVNDLGGGRFGEDPEKGAERPADAVVREIREAGGVAVANYDSVLDGDKIIDTAVKAFGRVDIVVNNAGILRDKSFQRMTDQDWRLIHDVHVKGVYKVARAAWPIFLKQRFGRLINTASSVGLYGNFGQANYSAAKMAMVGFSAELAGHGAAANISVNTLAPSAGTRLTATVLPPEAVEALRPEFVAPVVGYLCSPETFTTNGIYESGSGWTAKVRWQRARGAFLKLPHTVEDVQAAWGAVNDFSDPEYPTTFKDSTHYSMMAAAYNRGLKDGAGADSVHAKL